jgi:hypothetical protein
MPWDGQTVGFAILSVSDESDWRGYAWLADVLLEDSDPDRPKRIAVHELEHIRAWDEHGPFADSEDLPATFDERWYLAEADAKAPFTPIPEDELAWLASWRRLDVFVAAAGDLEREWLAMVLAEACDFVNDSAGEEVFRYGGIAGLED